MGFVLEQLSELDDITSKAMMGEYIIYYRGRVVGGIYDDRFLVKPTKSARAMMPDADLELPYEGAKEMLLVDNVENRDFLCELVEAMYAENKSRFYRLLIRGRSVPSAHTAKGGIKPMRNGNKREHFNVSIRSLEGFSCGRQSRTVKLIF